MDSTILWFIIILIIIGILIIISYAFSHLKGAPWLPTRRKKLEVMLNLVDIQPNETIYDLGSGDGRVLVSIVRRYDVNAIGIEINPFLYLLSQLATTILGLRRKITIYYGNFFKHDLSDADIVICYLLQETNDKLEEKLMKELKPTARVVSNSFSFKKLSTIKEDPESKIYAYRLKKS